MPVLFCMFAMHISWRYFLQVYNTDDRNYAAGDYHSADFNDSLPMVPSFPPVKVESLLHVPGSKRAQNYEDTKHQNASLRNLQLISA